MDVRMALHRSRQEHARPTSSLVLCDSIASIQLALGSVWAGGLRFVYSHVSGTLNEGYRDRCAQRRKERTHEAEAHLTVGMEEARGASEEATVHTRIGYGRDNGDTRAPSSESNTGQSVHWQDCGP